jgi:hypothetical protein
VLIDEIPDIGVLLASLPRNSCNAYWIAAIVGDGASAAAIEVTATCRGP